MRLAATLVCVALLVGGCSGLRDVVDGLSRPDLDVARTPLRSGEWNTQDRFEVVVREPGGATVRIDAVRSDGERVGAEGVSDVGHPVAVTLSDGTWDITYHVAGHKWETLRDIRVDATPPQPTGLETLGAAQAGAYTIGQGVEVEPGVRVRVVDGQTGAALATQLPYRTTGLTGNRIYTFLVAFGDEAGNWYNVTVQVRAGTATPLPASGAYTFGIVARYTNTAQVWDMEDLGAYATPAQARAAVGDAHLGTGYRLWPNETRIADIADDVVGPAHTTTAEVAFALYQWLYDNLDYDDARLSATDLLKPQDTVERGGGVCRDLAALYVSLLRAAGVPARLVSGYLSGSVDGFHAWVEFYGGSVGGRPAWVPVDVSPIDGPYDQGRALSAFGILRPDYLTLRVVPEAGETEGWSTALAVRYEYRGAEPRFTFEKALRPDATDQVGVLCVDRDSFRRLLANSAEECPRDDYDQYFPDFVRFTERVIDYGVELQSSSPGAEVTAEVAYPFVADVAPNTVEFVVYGQPPVTSWTVDPASGHNVARFNT